MEKKRVIYKRII
uniref:Uncharacterized protein n=1 Tax=Arundo donax TaxID=35708 RepID=A0A0A9CFL7_ARUDO